MSGAPGDQLSIFLHLSPRTHLLPKGDNSETSQVPISSLKLRLSSPLLSLDVASFALVSYKLKGHHLHSQYPGVEHKQQDYNTNIFRKGKTSRQNGHWPLAIVGSAGLAPRQVGPGGGWGWRISLVRLYSDFWEELPRPLFFVAVTPSPGRVCLDHYLPGRI